MTLGHNLQGVVRDTAERIINLEKEIKGLTKEYVAPVRAEIKELFDKAAEDGIDKKALKFAMQRAKLDIDTRERLDDYELAIEKMLE